MIMKVDARVFDQRIEQEQCHLGMIVRWSLYYSRLWNSVEILRDRASEWRRLVGKIATDTTSGMVQIRPNHTSSHIAAVIPLS